MSDVIEAVLDEVADAAGVSGYAAREVISHFLAIAMHAADEDTRAMLDALTACEGDRCLHVTSLAREHDGRKLCPACHRAQRMAEREDERMRATHGPEFPASVRVRRAG